ncbi:MAG: sulfotransferase domain-containing protein [Planctomycetota bacterium]|nr:sulfotransferase domain-containing protein [Planctomycetota bacterium]MDA1113146.1 sulfotransferase domain-containing protein [Planctomycetota bacterium]
MSRLKTKRVLTASYPKSGATWFRFLTYGIEKGWAMDSRSVKKHNPETGKNIDWPELAGDAERSFVKTHMPYWEGNLAANKADVVIVVVRNPFDCMMSRLSHNRLNGVEISEPHQLHNFFSSFISSANMKQYEIRPDRLDGGWTNHYESWRDAESWSKGLALVRFEDLIKDCSGELEKVNQALDLGWNTLDIERGSLFGSKKWMSALENHEVAHQIPGMFYSPARAQAFEAQGERFVGGKRTHSDYETFVKNHVGDFMKAFTAPCERLGYDLASIIESKRMR